MTNKKSKAIDQYTYENLLAIIPPRRKVIDVWMQNSYICVMLDNGLTIKMKKYDIERA